ncbi:MAG: hypothetical protein ABRQ38_13415 [Candidatus Eremiobacterota bacterium]
MKLKKEEKFYLLQLLDILKDTGEAFKAISNQEIDELYEDYLDVLEKGRKTISDYEETLKEQKEILEEITGLLSEVKKIIRNYIEFIDEEDIELIESSLKKLENLKSLAETIEIDIYADIPPPSIKLALTFDDAVKINGLLLHLLDIGKKLEQNDSKDDFIETLEQDSIIIEKEEKLYDCDCPVDRKIIEIFEEASDIIEIYREFIEKQKDLSCLRNAMEQIKIISTPLQQILAGHDKELKLLGLVNYLTETGKKLRHIHATMDGEEAENAIEDVLKGLYRDLDKIEAERNRYSIHDESDKIGIEALELCRKITENFIEAIEGNNVTLVKESFDIILEASELVSNYRKIHHEEKETSLPQYLIKTGKEIKSIYTSNLEDKEKYFHIMLERLEGDRKKLEEKKKKYFTDREISQEIKEQTSFIIKPVNTHITDIYDRAIEIINAYITFIEEEKNIKVINDSFKIALYIDYLLNETERMVEDIQSKAPEARAVIGEA